jgi:hypothetical protein
MKLFCLKTFRQLIDRIPHTIYDCNLTKYIKRGGEL